jgi:hypothetical protein
MAATLTPDVLALCRAIDDPDCIGEDRAMALSALADALEEAGDASASGLRQIINFDRRPWPIPRNSLREQQCWAWFEGPQAFSGLAPETFALMRGNPEPRLATAQPHKWFTSRHAAFLALAEALAAG